MSYIEITEEWVKDRVKITKEKLDDIKSLSLPGTFDEKILNLGSSLFHFIRLKELDLSRNVIEHLDGLSHLQCLENLNLYYNNVASLKELYKLRNNQKLTQLDLRLNPVARNEADYRLCLIHMLPLLIRLDDRCVKDEERKAALMYFGSDQSREFSPNKPDESVSNNQISLVKSHRKTHPRVDMVNRWTRGVLTEHYIDKDIFNEDGLHLNLNDVNFGEDGISAPREKEIRSVKEYSPRERLDVEREFSSSKHVEHFGNFSTVPVICRSDDNNFSNKNFHKNSQNDFSLHTTHLTDQAHGDGYGVNMFEQNKLSTKDVSSIKFEKSTENLKNQTLETNENINASIPRGVMNKICDLIDRYWNGSKSLHDNPKFIASFCNIISSHYSKLKPNNEDCKNLSNETKENNSKFQSCNYLADNDQLKDMKLTNETLKNQIKELRQKLMISEKFSELTELLKQSHATLISTNEQLRKQLDYQDRRNQIKNEK